MGWNKKRILFHVSKAFDNSTSVEVHKQYSKKYFAYYICCHQCIIWECCSLEEEPAIIVATDNDDIESL